MKIGLVTGEYPPMEGGVGAFTQELAKALHALGHEVHIITDVAARVKPAERADTIRESWQRINALREPFELPFASVHPRGSSWRWGNMSIIADIAIRYDLDLVNVQYQAAAYNMRSAAINFLPWRLRGIVPCVVTFHDLRVPYLWPKAGPIRPFVVRRLAQKAAGVIVTNDSDEADAQSFGVTALKNIPIGSNIPVYEPNPMERQEWTEQLSLPENGVSLAYFGFLNESKGGDTLIQSMIELGKKYHLTFIGGRTGASDSANNQLFFQQIDQLIDAYQLESRVHWTGFMSDRRVSTALHMADLVVLPYKDGVSLRRGTLMAALAHGCAIISTEPERPVPQLIHGENIWLIPPDDPQALAAAVRHLQKRPELRTKLGVAAQKTGELFGWGSISEETARFYDQVVV